MVEKGMIPIGIELAVFFCFSFSFFYYLSFNSIELTQRSACIVLVIHTAASASLEGLFGQCTRANQQAWTLLRTTPTPVPVISGSRSVNDHLKASSPLRCWQPANLA